MAFVQKHYVISFINFDPIYKSDLYTNFVQKKPQEPYFCQKNKTYMGY